MKNGKNHHLDEMLSFLRTMPLVKKEAFLLLVRTKTKQDLKSLRTEAVRNDEDELARFMEAAMTLRVFVEAGIPLTL